VDRISSRLRRQILRKKLPKAHSAFLASIEAIGREKTLRPAHFPAFRRIDDGPAQHSVKIAAAKAGHSDAAMTLGVYSHVAKEDDMRIAEILDPSGPFGKEKGVAVSQQPLLK
jgi:integrase